MPIVFSLGIEAKCTYEEGREQALLTAVSAAGFLNFRARATPAFLFNLLAQGYSQNQEKIRRKKSKASKICDL